MKILNITIFKLAPPHWNNQATLTAVEAAIRFSTYLAEHAQRLYASGGMEVTSAAARAILGKIRKGDLTDGFRLRDIQQKGWATLGAHDPVQAGLDRLQQLYWIVPQIIPPGKEGGRPSKVYRINPKTYQAKE